MLTVERRKIFLSFLFVFQGFLNQITRHISHFEGPQARFGVLGYWRAKKDFNALGSL